MIDQLISFETAKLAKEKGFDIKVEWCYSEDGSKFRTTVFRPKSLKPPDALAPTQSLLQKWLREEHNIHIHIIHQFYRKDNDTNEFSCYVNKNVVYVHFKTYEEALEQGLKEALLLIK